MPDVDAIRSLRHMIKSALRMHGLQCLSLEEERAIEVEEQKEDENARADIE